MAASVVGSHKLTEGDHTGVLTDSKASAALGSARRRLLLTNDPADLGVSMVVHWHKDHGEAYDPQVGGSLSQHPCLWLLSRILAAHVHFLQALVAGHGAKRGACLLALPAQAPSALQRRASIHDDGDTYIVTLTSHNLLKTVVEV